MALQGTLDTFALPEVLRLLATTGKSGRLDVVGDRGGGTVSVDSGSIVGLSADRVRDDVPPAETLFELLRLADGTFTFAVDEPVASGEPVAIETLLADAEAMLEEWRTIEVVVPNMASTVCLRADLPEAEVTIDRDRWATLAAIGSGATVGEIADALESSQLPTSRRIKSLVDSGLAEVARVAEARAVTEAAEEPADVVPVVNAGRIGAAPPGDVDPTGATPAGAEGAVPPPPPPVPGDEDRTSAGSSAPATEQGQQEQPDSGGADEGGHGKLRKFLSPGKS